MDCPAETQLPFTATFANDTIWYQMAQIKTSCLWGLVPVSSATAQLANLQQTHLAFFQAQAVAKSKTKTLSEFNANIMSSIWAIVQASNDSQLSNYWRIRSKLKASDYQ
jgi:hypothetical protein